MHFYFSLDLVTDKNRLSHCVGLQAQVFQLFADKVCRILVFEGQDSSDRWSLEATNDLTVELIRCCEYFSRENTALKRSHSSEKYDQHVDKHGQAWFSKVLVYIACRYGTGSRFYVDFGLNLRSSVK